MAPVAGLAGRLPPPAVRAVNRGFETNGPRGSGRGSSHRRTVELAQTRPSRSLELDQELVPLPCRRLRLPRLVSLHLAVRAGPVWKIRLLERVLRHHACPFG